MIFDLSPTQEIFRMSRSCRLIYTETKRYWSSKLKCTRLLQPFCNSETEINNMMDMILLTGAIISGSAALQLFERTSFNNNEIDIYVNFNQYKNAEMSIKRTSFQQKKQDSKSLKSILGNCFPFIDEIVKLQTFIKPNLNKRIHLIGTRESPVLAILNFHSSKHNHITIIIFGDSPTTPPNSLSNELRNKLYRIQLLSFFNILPQNFTRLWNI